MGGGRPPRSAAMGGGGGQWRHDIFRGTLHIFGTNYRLKISNFSFESFRHVIVGAVLMAVEVAIVMAIAEGCVREWRQLRRVVAIGGEESRP